MRFGVLGPLDVRTDDGRPVRVPELKVRALLAVLLAHEGRPVSSDRLVEDLWRGERPPAKPVGALRVKVSQLRKVLEEAEPDARGLVVSTAPGYRIEADADSARFAALIARARDAGGDARARARLLSGALALWRGPAFAGFADEEFAGPAAARLEEQRLTALEDLAEARLELGEHAALVGELGDLAHRHPLRERFQGSLMRALYRSGRQNEALGVYRGTRDRLREDLGLEPGAELAALHQAILRHDPALAPPPAAAPRPRTNLPAALSGLVGREEETAALRALLGDAGAARLVTLTGPAGVGKTRLAVEAAAARADGGDPVHPVHPVPLVHLVELGGLPGAGQTPGTVAEAMIAALGLGHDGSDPAARRLADAFGAGPALLVADNCEHVIEPVAELAARLLEAAPGLRILATSREPLGVPGELVRPVPPLETPGPGPADPAVLMRSPAVRLFVARASAAAPGFALDAGNGEAVATLCRRLDGIPLALELAAARAGTMGVQALAGRLDDRFRLLSTGRRGTPARQRTLRATIDWSWDLLTGPERAVLRRLAVHSGGCTLEGAERVCGGDGVDPAELPDVLASLVNRSLVVLADGDRYRLLESVAAYGLDRLREAGEYERTVRRHGRYYTFFAECADAGRYGHARLGWLDRLDAETANLRSALERALGRRDTDLAVRLTGALTWYWLQRGRPAEARRSLGLALVEAARDLHLDGLDAARAGGDPAALASALEGLAGAQLLGGRDRHAARLLGAARTVREAVPPATGTAPPPDECRSALPAEPGNGCLGGPPDMARAASRVAASVRAALGEDGFAAEFVAGMTAGLDEVIAEPRRTVNARTAMEGDRTGSPV